MSPLTIHFWMLHKSPLSGRPSLQHVLNACPSGQSFCLFYWGTVDTQVNNSGSQFFFFLLFHATQVYSTVIHEDRKNELAHSKKKKNKPPMWLLNPIKNNSFHKSLKKLGGSELTLTRQRRSCFYCFLWQFKSCSKVINLSFQAGGLQEWCIFLA